jgi:hypothetical protein
VLIFFKISGNLKLLEPSGPVKACYGIAFTAFLPVSLHSVYDVNLNFTFLELHIEKFETVLIAKETKDLRHCYTVAN